MSSFSVDNLPVGPNSIVIVRRLSITLGLGTLLLFWATFLGKSLIKPNGGSDQWKPRESSISTLVNVDRNKRSHRTKSSRPLKSSKRAIQITSTGIHFEKCALNEAISYLAAKAGLNFSPNQDIVTEDYLVTGRLDVERFIETYGKTEWARGAIDELSFQYGLTDYISGDGLEILTKEQVANYPPMESSFAIREWLANSGEEQIYRLISQLSPPSERSSVHLEAETCTLTIVDTPFRIARVDSLLKAIGGKRPLK